MTFSSPFTPWSKDIALLLIEDRRHTPISLVGVLGSIPHGAALILDGLWFQNFRFFLLNNNFSLTVAGILHLRFVQFSGIPKCT